MKYSLIMAIFVFSAIQANAANETQNWYPDAPSKTKGTTPLKERYDWKHAFIRVENKLTTPVELVVYKKNKSGELKEVMKPDAKGRDTDKIDTYRLDPTHLIYFYMQNSIFADAIDKCIYRVEAFILDSSGKRTGEHWYADGDREKKIWCKDHVDTKVLGIFKDKTEGYHGWKLEVRQKEGSTDKEIWNAGYLGY